MTLDEMTIVPPEWVQADPVEPPVQGAQLQLTAVDEYLLEIDNGFALSMWPQLGDPDRWEVEILRMGLFGGEPLSPAIVGLWPWQMSGLAPRQVERVQQLVTWLEPGAKPVPAEAMPEPEQEGDEW